MYYKNVLSGNFNLLPRTYFVNQSCESVPWPCQDPQSTREQASAKNRSIIITAEIPQLHWNENKMAEPKKKKVKGAAVYSTNYDEKLESQYPIGPVNGNKNAFFCIPCQKKSFL